MRIIDNVKSGTQSVRTHVDLYQSATGAAPGQGLTGLLNTSTGLSISIADEGAAAPTVFTAAASNIETITTLGTYAAPSTSAKIRFKEFDATNAPGRYELHLHNAHIDGPGRYLDICIKGVTNLLDSHGRIWMNLLDDVELRALVIDAVVGPTAGHANLPSNTQLLAAFDTKDVATALNQQIIKDAQGALEELLGPPIGASIVEDISAAAAAAASAIAGYGPPTKAELDAAVAVILAATFKANVKQVNDVPYTGTGVLGDEHVPA